MKSAVGLVLPCGPYASHESQKWVCPFSLYHCCEERDLALLLSFVGDCARAVEAALLLLFQVCNKFVVSLRAFEALPVFEFDKDVEARASHCWRGEAYGGLRLLGQTWLCST